MSLLAVDAGNTRIKWALRDGTGNWAEYGFAPANALAAEMSTLTKLATQAKSVGLCCVGGQDMRQQLEEVFAQVSLTEIVASESCAGVRNGYAKPHTLGADRWCALLALRAKFGHGVVVTAGTALTVDGLDQAGSFTGGLILPGRNAMVSALGTTTQLRLPVADELDAVSAAAITSTAEAVGTGVLAAAVGAIKWYINQRGFESAPLVLAGGDAAWLATHLPQAQVNDALIFAGIASALESS